MTNLPDRDYDDRHLVSRHECDLRCAALRDHTDQALAALERHIDLRFDNQDEKVETASASMNIRLERMNEFRDQLSTERLDYARKDQVANQIQAVMAAVKAQGLEFQNAIGALEKGADIAIGKNLGVWALVGVAGISLITLGGNLVIRLLFG